MRVELDERQQAVRAEARAFARQDVAARAAEIDRACRLPLELAAAVGTRGLGAVFVPPPEGRGLDFLSHCLVVEELARKSASLAAVVSRNALVCQALCSRGSASQRRHYLRRLAGGEVLGCLSAGWRGPADAPAPELTASVQGDGWIVRGSAANVVGGASADVALVFARRGDESELCALLVPLDSEGVKRGPEQRRLGLNGAGLVELTFDGVELPADSLLGAAGEGAALAGELRVDADLALAAQAVGLAQEAFAAALERSRSEGEGDGRNRQQAFQFYLADMGTEIDAARLLVWKAAWAKRQGRRYALEAAQACLFATATARRATDLAMQIHGEAGTRADLDVERLFRDARVLAAPEGSSELQMENIAAAILEG